MKSYLKFDISLNDIIYMRSMFLGGDKFYMIPVLKMKIQNSAPEITISKYRATRYWAVWIGKELLAVVVYKKGALAIKESLSNTRKAL